MCLVLFQLGVWSVHRALWRWINVCKLQPHTWTRTHWRVWVLGWHSLRKTPEPKFRQGSKKWNRCRRGSTFLWESLEISLLTLQTLSSLQHLEKTLPPCCKASFLSLHFFCGTTAWESCFSYLLIINVYIYECT